MYRIVENESKYIFYNISVDSIVTVPKKYGKIEELLLNEDIIDFLKDNLIILDNDIEPNTLSRYMINKSKYSNDTLTITDAFTYKCNMKCCYCMQQNTYKDVKELDVSSRLDIWEKIITLTNPKYIKVVFFGGEPFYDYKKMESIISESKKRRIDINEFSCVSNGINICQEAIEIINKYHFSTLQITLDGDKKTHNIRRIAKKTRNSFDVIISNIHTILEKTKANVIINTVLDKNNMYTYKKLIDFLVSEFPDYLYGDDPRIKFNVGQECHPVNKSEYTENSIPAIDEYSLGTFQCKQYIIDKDLKLYNPLPSPICINKKENDIIISPDGDIYHCISAIGINEFMMISKEDLMEKPMKFFINQIKDIEKITDKNCCECEFYALCNGGCKYNAFIEGKSKDCNKYFFTKYINFIILQLAQIREKQGDLVEYCQY